MDNINLTLENIYNESLKREQDGKIIFDKIKKEYNDVVIKYNSAESNWYNLTISKPNLKESYICVWTGEKHYGLGFQAFNACQTEHVGGDGSGTGYQALWLRDSLQMRGLVFLLDTAKINKDNKEKEYNIALTTYNQLRIASGKALSNWNNWKKQQLTADELSEFNKDVWSGGALDEFSWKFIGYGFGLLVLFFGFIWILKRI